MYGLWVRHAAFSTVSLFVFYGSGDHRDLHSFPTRRSSDLRRRRQLRDALPRERCRAQARQARHSRVDLSDRKSTRLNSSHSQISYAVFCLKKKSETKMEEVVRRSTSERDLSVRSRSALTMA